MHLRNLKNIVYIIISQYTKNTFKTTKILQKIEKTGIITNIIFVLIINMLLNDNNFKK